MKLLLDNNLPPVMARSIQLLVAGDGHIVVALRDRFPANTPDVEWLGTLGAEGGWSILTLDQMIARRPAERLALHRSQVTAYFMAAAWQKLTTLEKTARLLLCWPKLCQAATLVRAGALFELPVNAGSTLRQIRL